MHLKIIAIITLGHLLLGCNSSNPNRAYLNKSSISKENGQPVDSSSLYFPSKLGNKTVIDPDNNIRYSKILFAAKEPVLFNNYQGHTVYRFTWIRASNAPVIISIHESGNEAWLAIKKLNKDPGAPTLKQNGVRFPSPDGKSNDRPPDKFDKEHYLDQIRKALLIIDDKRNLTEKEVLHFKQLLKHTHFWELSPYENAFGLDGSRWIVEAHLKNKYWFVDRWSPEDDFRKCGEYLITLSGLKEIVY